MIKDAMTIAQMSKHKRQLDHLSQKLHGVPLAGAIAAIGADLPPIMPGLDFQCCGVPYSLIGIPGTNPSNPNDYFWQHHAAMYYDLLEKIPIPTAIATVATGNGAAVTAAPVPSGVPG
jgi:hypothetical protein